MKNKKMPDYEEDIYTKLNAVSSTECTGLITVPPQNDDELENYKNIYEYEISVDDIK